MREAQWQARKHVKSLRHDQTDAERILWQGLRAKRLEGYKFRRQHPIESYIVDFACLSAKLIIEIDGELHETDEAQAYDARRSAVLGRLGWHVMRFWNDDVYDDADGVLDAISLHLQGQASVAPPSERFAPTSPVNGGGRQ